MENRSDIKLRMENGTDHRLMKNSSTALSIDHRYEANMSIGNQGNTSPSSEHRLNNSFAANQSTKIRPVIENHVNTTAPKDSAIPVRSVTR